MSESPKRSSNWLTIGASLVAAVAVVAALLAVGQSADRSDQIDQLTVELDEVSAERDDLRAESAELAGAADLAAERSALTESRWLASVAVARNFSPAQNRLLAVEATNRSMNPQSIGALGQLLFADAVSEPPIAELDHEGPVWVIDVGQTSDLVVTGSDDNTTKLWSSNGDLVQTMTHPGRVRAVDFSGDDQRLAVGSADGTAAIWTVDGDELGSVGHADQVNAIVANDDGSMFVSGGSDGAVLVVDSEDSEVRYTFEHPDTIWTLALSQDEGLVASGSQDGNARVWDLQSGELASVYEVGEPVTVVEFSPDGAWLFVGAQRGSAFLVDLATGQAQDLLEGDFPGGVLDLDWHPDGSEMAVVSLGSINRYDVVSGEPLGAHRLAGGARGVAYGPDGTWFASASGDFQFSFGEIAFWDTAAGVKMLNLNLGGPVEAIAVHPSGAVLGSFRAVEDLVETGGAWLVPGPGGWVGLACEGSDGIISESTWSDVAGESITRQPCP